MRIFDLCECGIGFSRSVFVTIIDLLPKHLFQLSKYFYLQIQNLSAAINGVLTTNLLYWVLVIKPLTIRNNFVKLLKDKKNAKNNNRSKKKRKRK